MHRNVTKRGPHCTVINLPIDIHMYIYCMLFWCGLGFFFMFCIFSNRFCCCKNKSLLGDVCNLFYLYQFGLLWINSVKVQSSFVFFVLFYTNFYLSKYFLYVFSETDILELITDEGFFFFLMKRGGGEWTYCQFTTSFIQTGLGILA